jgi:hypothetical protein
MGSGDRRREDVRFLSIVFKAYIAWATPASGELSAEEPRPLRDRFRGRKTSRRTNRRGRNQSDLLLTLLLTAITFLSGVLSIYLLDRESQNCSRDAIFGVQNDFAACKDGWLQSDRGAEATSGCLQECTRLIDLLDDSGSPPINDASINCLSRLLCVDMLSWKARLSPITERFAILSQGIQTANKALSLCPAGGDMLYEPSISLRLATLYLHLAVLDHPSAGNRRAELFSSAQRHADYTMHSLGWAHFNLDSAEPLPARDILERERIGRKALYRQAQIRLKASRIYGIEVEDAVRSLRSWMDKVLVLANEEGRAFGIPDLQRISEEDEEDGLEEDEVEDEFWCRYIDKLRAM